MFLALANGSPTEEDVLVVLARLQPVLDQCFAPMIRSELVPMAARLRPQAIDIGELRIPEEKLVAFMRGLGMECSAVEEDADVDFEVFRGVVDGIATPCHTSQANID